MKILHGYVVLAWSLACYLYICFLNNILLFERQLITGNDHGPTKEHDGILTEQSNNGFESDADEEDREQESENS